MIARCLHRRSLIPALLLFLTAAIALRATTLAPLSLEQLTSAAAVIVHASCAGTESLWHDGEIWTVTSFRVEEIWKGNVPHEFQIWMLGGRVGPITSYVPGAPRFVRGEEAVLFLEATRSGLLSITAWSEGTFRVRRDPRSGEERITQDTASLPVFDPGARRFLSSGIRDWPLGKLKARILAAEVDAAARRKKE